MTLDEVKTVANIIGTADNGCETCIDNLIKRFNDSFPAYRLTRTGERQVEPDEWDEGEVTQCGWIVSAEQVE